MNTANEALDRLNVTGVKDSGLLNLVKTAVFVAVPQPSRTNQHDFISAGVTKNINWRLPFFLPSLPLSVGQGLWGGVVETV